MQSFSFPGSVRRGVGRRIFLLLLLAGALPVLATGALSYYEFNRSNAVEVGNKLHRSAKSYGVDILGKLLASSEKATEFEMLARNGNSLDLDKHDYLLSPFDAVWRQEIGGEIEHIAGNPAAIAGIGEFDMGYLLSGNTQLVLSGADSIPHLVLLRALESETGPTSVLAFSLRPATLLASTESTPYATEFCVFTESGVTMSCSRAFDPAVHDKATSMLARDHKTPFEWQQGDDDYLATAWQLFLGSTLKGPSLDIVALQNKRLALESSADFRRVVLPALAVVLLLVVFASYNLIGRSLIPLHKLTLAAGQLAEGNLQSRVRLNSGDEFGALANTFNHMAHRLGDEIELLKTMSEIDRMILSGAGFQEVSVRILDHLAIVSDGATVAVVAREDRSARSGTLVTLHDGEVTRETVDLPSELGENWYQPRQVDLVDEAEARMPFRARFMESGCRYVMVVPVMQARELTGILLLGSGTALSLTQQSVRRCIDLAGRFAVAFSSVERERMLYQRANFDDLTGLPNRQLMKHRLGEMIEAARSYGHRGALLYLDVDRFKEINDVFGHSVGDIVLVQAAERIVNEVRQGDLVSRIGGDEFVVILPKFENEQHVHKTADRLIDRFRGVFSVQGENHFVGASIGIVVFPDDGESIETLLKNADSAMYRAKECGRARYQFFSQEMNAVSRRKIELERDLRASHDADELEIYYQPQFDLITGEISGAEALLRWEHAEHGFVSPSEFIPLAEESELIVDIGRRVVDQACRDLHDFLEEGMSPGPLSINVSARQLGSTLFLEDVLGSMRRFGIHPGHLQLEITETAVAQNQDTAIELLRTLRDAGLRVAIDDFGTGYSSLSYLQNMPFDVIKIDKSFVSRIGDSESSDNICRTIIRMAHELGKHSIAEGVETTRQRDFLRRNACDFVQGFLYSEPMPTAEFVEFLRKQEAHTQRRRALEVV